MTTKVPIQFFNPETEETFQFTALDPSLIAYNDKMGIIVQEVPGADGGIINVTGKILL